MRRVNWFAVVIIVLFLLAAGKELLIGFDWKHALYHFFSACITISVMLME